MGCMNFDVAIERVGQLSLTVLSSVKFPVHCILLTVQIHGHFEILKMTLFIIRHEINSRIIPKII